MKNVILLLVSLSGPFAGLSQKFITGTIIDAVTEDPVSYANISVQGSTYGTASDEGGKFSLQIKSDDFQGTLVISSIGYKNAELSVDSLFSKADLHITVAMQSSALMLSEVEVKGELFPAEVLVKESLNSIEKNYYQHPFNMTFYSSVIVDDPKSPFKLETVIESYRPGYVQSSVTSSKIVQKRETGRNPLKPIKLQGSSVQHFPYSPVFDIFLIDQIGTGSGKLHTVFNPSTFKKLSFQYESKAIFDNDTIWAVTYSNRNLKVASKEKYNGTIYIAISTGAIVRHSVKIGSSVYDVIYKKISGFYFPYLIKSFTDDQSRYPFPIKNEIVLKNVEMKVVKKIDHDLSQVYPESVSYNESFWHKYYQN